MRKWIAVAAMTLAPVTAKAQVEYQFTNTQNNASGLTTTLLFRNIGGYDAPTIVTFASFVVQTSPRFRAACAPGFWNCNIGGNSQVYTVGNVQQQTFTVDGATFRTDLTVWSEDSCGGQDCLSRAYIRQGDPGVLPCRLPAQGTTYFARTCAADGYDGWLALNLALMVQRNGTFDPLPAFDVSDLSVSFNGQPNAINVTATPEPSTYALMAAGLVILGFVARRRSVGA